MMYKLSENKSAYRDAMVQQIMERDDIYSDLERLAKNYFPSNVHVFERGRRISTTKHCVDYFIEGYQYHRETGWCEEDAIYKGLSNVVTHVLLERERAYE